MTPADLIRIARTRHGLTQRELGARLGMSQPVISAYEHGRRDPSVGTLTRLISGTDERLELRLAPRPTATHPLIGPSDHAAALVDVLLLADAIPNRRPLRPLAFPRIDSRRSRLSD